MAVNVYINNQLVYTLLPWLFIKSQFKQIHLFIQLIVDKCSIVVNNNPMYEYFS